VTAEPPRGQGALPAIAPDRRADAAAAAVLRALAATIEASIPGAISGADPEHLHQLRVALRRTRTVARQLAGVFEPSSLPGFRADLRWLQRATGPARDLDVYVGQLDSLLELVPAGDRAALQGLAPALERRRLRARAALTEALTSSRTSQLLADWEAMLESLVAAPTLERPDALLAIGDLAARRVRRCYERVIRPGRRLGPSSPAADYHELRKRAKELRYMLELFGPVLPASVVDALVGPLRALQDVLGRHQDREVQIALLRSLADELARTPGGGTACLVMGILCARLEADAARARERFAKRLSVLASRSQRRLVASLLGG